MDVNYKMLQEHGARRTSDLILQLRKSLYGLKQAGRLWSQLLHKRIIVAGLVQCVVDMCLYRKKDGEDIVLVGVYVEDLPAAGPSAEEVDLFFVSLKSLSIKDYRTCVEIFGHARGP